MFGQIRRAVWITGLIALALRLARLAEAPDTDPFYAVYLLDSCSGPLPPGTRPT